MLNVLVPARNEFPQALWTIYSIIDDIPTYIPHHVTLVCNGSSQETQQEIEWLQSATLCRKGKLDIVDTPACHPQKACDAIIKDRNLKGYILFADAHIAVKHGTIPEMMNLAGNGAGMVHCPMLYLGDVYAGSKLYGYKDPLKRGWTWQKPENGLISSGGFAFCMTTVKHWLKIGGLQEPLRQGCGGGETLADMKTWMFNSKVAVASDGLFYHYARRRGYRWTMGEFYWNQLVARYVLDGAESMRLYNCGFAYPQNEEILQEIVEKARKHRRFIQENAKFTLQEVLKAEPWNSLHIGARHSGVTHSAGVPKT